MSLTTTAAGAWKQGLGNRIYGIMKSSTGRHKEWKRLQTSACCSLVDVSERMNSSGVTDTTLPWFRWNPGGSRPGLPDGSMFTRVRLYCSSASTEVMVKESKKRNRKKFFWETKRPKHEKTFKLPIEYKPVGDTRLQELYEEYPELEEIDPEDLRTVMTEGALYGFSPTRIARIIVKYPDFMQRYHELLPESAKIWRRIGVNEEDRAKLFYKQPDLMALNWRQVFKAHNFLRSYFSGKEFVNLLIYCPAVVVDNEIVLKEKIDLLWKVYSHSPSDICKCEVLKKSVNEVRIRHEFLIRAGLFKAISFYKLLKLEAEKERRRVPFERDRYFTPNAIMCCSTDKFLRVCTRDVLSVDELAAFEVFYKEELRRKGSDEIYEELEEPPFKDFEESEDQEELVDRDSIESHNLYFYDLSSSSGFYNVKDGVDFYY